MGQARAAGTGGTEYAYVRAEIAARAWEGRGCKQPMAEGPREVSIHSFHWYMIF